MSKKDISLEDALSTIYKILEKEKPSAWFFGKENKESRSKTYEKIKVAAENITNSPDQALSLISVLSKVFEGSKNQTIRNYEYELPNKKDEFLQVCADQKKLDIQDGNLSIHEIGRIARHMDYIYTENTTFPEIWRVNEVHGVKKLISLNAKETKIGNPFVNDDFAKRTIIKNLRVSKEKPTLEEE